MMDMNRDVLALARVGGTVIPPRLAHTAGPDHNAAGEVVRVRLAPGLRPEMGGKFIWDNIMRGKNGCVLKFTLSVKMAEISSS